jgi:hypothetical protein
MRQKDARIKELQNSVAEIEKQYKITRENRKEAAQSEAVVIKNTGMTEEMQKEAISIAKQAFQKYDKQ